MTRVGKFVSASPGVLRAFCRRCGSPLYSRRPGAPGVFPLRLGILNEDPDRRSVAHCFVASKATWFAIDDDLPQFTANPPSAA